MDLKYLDSARALADSSPQLTEQLRASGILSMDDECAPYWAFREIGSAMARKRSPLPKKEFRVIFERIERNMKSDDFDLANLTATCLLETFYSCCQDSGFEASQVDEFIKPATRAYLTSWDQFCAKQGL